MAAGGEGYRGEGEDLGRRYREPETVDARKVGQHDECRHKKDYAAQQGVDSRPHRLLDALVIADHYDVEREENGASSGSRPATPAPGARPRS